MATKHNDSCLTMLVDNPAALERLELGKYYYFDISEAPQQ